MRHFTSLIGHLQAAAAFGILLCGSIF